MAEKPNNELRDMLFPEGKPEPDEFIIAMAELVKQLREEREENKKEKGSTCHGNCHEVTEG